MIDGFLHGARLLASLIYTSYVPVEKLSGPVTLPNASPRARQDSPLTKYIDGIAGVEVVGHIAPWNPMHDVKVSVIGRESVRG
jgi:hypothetical protein